MYVDRIAILYSLVVHKPYKSKQVLHVLVFPVLQRLPTPNGWVGIHIPQEAQKRTIEQQLTQLQQSVAGLQIH